jgi:hypothetical protein
MSDKSSFEILASAARTATPTIAVITSATLAVSTKAMTNLQVIIDATAATATPVVQVALQAQDPVSSKWYDLIASIADITAVGTTVLSFGENTPVVANLGNQGFIPDNIRLTLTHTDADSITYSVGLNYSTK